MKELDGIINFYLNNETNSAILITGDWGVGKTHYFKNTLEKQIAQTDTFHDASRKYKPILVSLFGLSTLEDVQTQIFLSLYPILENKKFKIGAAIGKVLIKAILNFKDLGDYYDIVSEAGINKKDLVNFNNLVICFDDLERVSSNFQLEELIGFINSLTESNNAKIIIIANENQLNKEKFIHLKEKVIGNTIEYIPNVEIIYDSLVSNKFSGSPSFKKFLAEKKQYILQNFISYTNNIRTLFFISTYYHNIFSHIEINSPKYKFIDENKESILNITLKFTITIAIEYKKGSLSYKKKTEIDNSTFDILDISLEKIAIKRFIQNNEENEPKSYKEGFLEKYYGTEQYRYFESIFNFITGGNVFDEILFLSELKALYNVQDDTIPTHYEVFNKLAITKVFDLTNDEYLKLTRQLLNYSDKGLFKIENYPTIFYYIARFNNPLNFNSLENIEKRIIKGIRKGKHSYQYVPNLELYLTVNPNSEFYTQITNIIEICLAINNEIKEMHDKIEYQNLEKLYADDFDAFDLNLVDKNLRYYSPVFNHFNLTKFYNFYINSEISTKKKVNSLFRYRYQIHMYDTLNEEIDFMKALHIKINKKLKGLKSGLEFFVYREFENILSNTIDGMKPHI